MKTKNLLLIIFACSLLVFLSACDSNGPDLIVDHISVTNWDNSEMRSNVAIKNIGNETAQNVRVYFNLEEDPESSNHRPQYSKVVDNILPNEQKSWSVFWNHPVNGLQHPDNQNLGNVTGITIIVDPKSEIVELDEANNSMSVIFGP